jgi:hypothetical protein
MFHYSTIPSFRWTSHPSRVRSNPAVGGATGSDFLLDLTEAKIAARAIMNFLDHMLIYFKGEKNLGVFLIVLGIAILIFVGYLWQAHKGWLAYGMIIPLLIFGLASIGGGAALAYRTNKQILELTNLYQSDKQAFAAQEQSRMGKVNDNWPRLKLAYAVIIVISLGLVIFLKKIGLPDWHWLSF